MWNEPRCTSVNYSGSAPNENCRRAALVYTHVNARSLSEACIICRTVLFVTPAKKLDSKIELGMRYVCTTL
jgi:hypothetical protein